KSLFDAMFFLVSALLAIFFGAALGNVIRGVPLDAQGFFFEPLWTNFHVSHHPGILDWYTVLAGVVALSALTCHGALYIAVKAEGALYFRAPGVAGVTMPLLFFFSLLGLVAPHFLRPSFFRNTNSPPLS